MMDEIKIGLVSILCTIVIIVLILVTCAWLDITKWNNGYHSCGGKWEYIQPIGHAYNTAYLYECNKCGVTHEFDIRR